MSEQAPTLSEEAAELEKLFNLNEGEKNSKYKLAWNYLQRFAHWGVRLPIHEPDFELLLHTKAYAAYDFFPPLKDGCTLVQSASESFISTYLPNILAVGNTLHVFAENGAIGEGDMFGEVIKLLRGPNANLAGAKEIIDDMISDAHEAHEQAGNVQEDLGKFKTELVKAQGKFTDAGTKIANNDQVNQKKINELTDPNLATSLASLEKHRKEFQAEYDHDVVVASTTVTYAWVGFPFLPVGLIAAASVAGYFGDEAVQTLAKLEKAEADIKAAGQALHTAVGTQNVLHLGADALANLSKYTDAALVKLKTVQDGWNSILTNLQGLSGQIDKAVKTTTEGEKLKSVTIVKIKLEHAGKWWTKLYPLLKEATTDPYINVENSSKSVAEFNQDVKKHIVKAA